MQIDEYGQLPISENHQTPRRGWAYTPQGEIDPKLIFSTRERAEIYARLMADTAPTILEVTVRGIAIEPV